MIASCCREWRTLQKTNQPGDYTKTVASLPRPPKVENTRGVNDANSTDRSDSVTILTLLLKVMSTKQGSNRGTLIAIGAFG